MNPDNDEKISRLYQQIDKAAPSELLDARIRQAARQQVPGKRKSHLLGWLSTAALLVISVGLVLRVMQEAPVEQDFSQQLDLGQQRSKQAPAATQALPQKAPAELSLAPPKLQEEAIQFKVDKEVMLDAVVSEKKKSRQETAAEPANWCEQYDLESEY